MPRKFYRRKRYSRRHSALSYKQKKAVGAIAAKAVRGQQEFKYWDTTNGAGVSTTGSTNDVSLITQGDSDTTRDGDKVRISSVRYRCTAVGADTTNLVRFILFVWRADDNVDAPSFTKILSDTSVPIVSPYIHDTGYKFKILKDFVIPLSLSGSDVGWRQGVISFRSKKLRKFSQISFNAGGTTGRNKVYLFIISDSTAVAHPSFQFFTRISYTDS